MNKRKDDKTKDFRKTQHSVYLITLHVVLVIKYRRKVLTNPISDEVRRIFTYIGEEHGVDIVEWKTGCDHLPLVSIKSALFQLQHLFWQEASPCPRLDV